jgi:putative hydrolase of the HAD superfamily
VAHYGDIGAVLFDLDGTLIEHTRDIRDICRETFEVFGDRLAPVGAEKFWEVFWPKNHDMWYMVTDGVLAGDVARLYSFVNTLRALKADESLAAEMLREWEGRILAATRLFEDVLSTVGRLRSAGLRVGVVTNGYATMQRQKIDYHRLDIHIDFIMISEEVGAYKPERAIFDLALANAEVAARRALFVGDTPTADIEGARQAGLHAALIDPHDTWPEFTDERVPKLRRLSELLPLLGLA